jgi:hypothetical protein
LGLAGICLEMDWVNSWTRAMFEAENLWSVPASWLFLYSNHF